MFFASSLLHNLLIAVHCSTAAVSGPTRRHLIQSSLCLPSVAAELVADTLALQLFWAKFFGVTFGALTSPLYKVRILLQLATSLVSLAMEFH